MDFARIFMKLSYDGTDYSGWQIQPNAPSIQGAIEEALFKLNGNQHVGVTGCGRTDAGVHAKSYYAHFDWEKNKTKNLLYRMNKMLGNAIKIHSFDVLEEPKHARFDAKKRTYRYFISKEKEPFNDRFQWNTSYDLNVNAMNQAGSFLIGTYDFASFAKLHTDVKTTICEVYYASWIETQQAYIFEISANRFLRNMVRAIVGTLIEVGIGKMKPEEISDLIAKKNRQEAAVSVPAKGLFLWDVEY